MAKRRVATESICAIVQRALKRAGFDVKGIRCREGAVTVNDDLYETAWIEGRTSRRLGKLNKPRARRTK